MTDVLGAVAFLVLPLVGLALWRLEAVRRLALDGRIAVAAAAGAITIAVVMAVISAIGLQWTRTRLFVAFIVIVCASVTFAFRGGPALERPDRVRNRAALIALIFLSALAIYGTLTARQTSGDLSFFWGPKGVRFFRGGGIDATFLRDPNYFLMHSDYPPLVPLLYAWSNTVSRQFSSWAAIFSGTLFILGCVAMIRTFSGNDQIAVLAAGVMTYAHAISYSAGGADPPLLLFETLTLVALTFVEDRRDQAVLAALGLAGAAWTKVEGTTFVIAVVLALMVVRREIVRPLKIAAPASLLLASWLFFAWRNGLLDTYLSTRERMRFDLLPVILSTLSAEGGYGAVWLPWIAVVTVIILGGQWRVAALPLVVCALTIAATIFFYLNHYSPELLIRSSAKRVLQTPLVALVVAAAAASRVPHSRQLRNVS